MPRIQRSRRQARAGEFRIPDARRRDRTCDCAQEERRQPARKNAGGQNLEGREKEDHAPRQTGKTHGGGDLAGESLDRWRCPSAEGGGDKGTDCSEDRPEGCAEGWHPRTGLRQGAKATGEREPWDRGVAKRGESRTRARRGGPSRGGEPARVFGRWRTPL